MINRLLSLLTLVVILTGCQTATEPNPVAMSAAAANADSPHLFDALGDYHRAVTTTSEEAQRYFDQGLIWAYSFNHGEAIRSFRAAAEADPWCAMAWWGIALCNGPHINNPVMTAENYKAATDALELAKVCVQDGTDVEKALVAALAKRYAPTPPADRRPLDQAYADAMAGVLEQFPEDNDVATLYAESMMDLQPWDLWTADGKPKGQAERIVAILEGVLQDDEAHPGAVHYYIHAVEASPNPQRAQAAADRLRTLVPAAGHMVHMPSHIDARLGHWSAAVDANACALEADRQYREIRPNSGFWNVYMLHNRHFLTFASMMEGRSALALDASRAMINSVPADWLAQNPALVDPYMAIVVETQMRFGRWDAILSEPAPSSKLPITTAMSFFARGVARAAKGEVYVARTELEHFLTARRNVPADAMFAVNKAHTILDIAEHVLRGEIAYRDGDIEQALSELRTAVQIEDGLRYMEPPEWIQPVRHTLGAVLLEAGRAKEAEQVYRDDLRHWPENGWALWGLSKSLAAQNKGDEAEVAKTRFQSAWQHADIRIGSTCMCVDGAQEK